MNRIAIVIVFLLVVSTFILTQGLFIVDKRQKALVFRFGEITAIYNNTPGLKFKIPFIDEVVYYDSRLLGYDLQNIELTLMDQKRITSNLFVRYFIDNPLLFYKRANNMMRMNRNLEQIISSAIQQVMGKTTLKILLSKDRTNVESKIHSIVEPQLLNDYGVKLLDLRIVRTDLPTENQSAIFIRMKSDREAQAAEIRAIGKRNAIKIKAEANRDVKVVLAQATKESKILEGEGKAISMKILSSAYNTNKKFFELFKTLSEYKRSFIDGSKKTIMVGSDHEFLKLMKNGIKGK